MALKILKNLRLWSASGSLNPSPQGVKDVNKISYGDFKDFQ